MVRLKRALLVVLGFLAPALWGQAAIGGSSDRLIFVTSNGWHSGIVVARSAVSLAVLPEAADFPEATYLEFGWGDADYYPAPRPTFGLALLAALPGPAVIHLSGLADHPAKIFPTVTLLAVPLSDGGLERLITHLAASFDRAGAVRVKPSARGLYSFSQFYPATGKFHLFNTCNTWTARALAAAGLAIDPDGVQTAAELVTRVRPLAQPD
ncbi:MAG: DUF2459 domain-containing protein [Alphaproteobacteria bacterium]